MLGITAAWGACFVAIRLGLGYAPPLWYASLRALVAAALLAFAALDGRAIPRGARNWSLIAVLGLLNVTLGLGAMFVATARLATGIVAVLSNAQPLLIPVPASRAGIGRLRLRRARMDLCR